eukprot:gnl/TRDRNA2_/TRDRNA2_71393_c0_seq1.p1 gnl/TRDRNA2_/TRDRNA2_71393_c0~~gnl/TRDRNA2_/TRDRNA2_71393_c0_seq1.p1  ORF type:complete len:417 (-),score=52.99 gnl/TRDRNA2_/TRDRNA2_71393_c0_seq1:161-1411(-)
MSSAPKVAVVGAGVAGLICARELERAGLSVEVFEAAAAVGGRVRTEDVDGYKLDVGFQILIDSYPEVRRQLNLKALELRSYAPGAVLANAGQLSIVAHPLKCPLLLLASVRTATQWGLLTSCFDVLRLLRLALGWLFSSPYSLLRPRLKLETTDEFLQHLGLSSMIVQRFLRPFFEAIYVTPLSEQSSAMFQFVLRMLASGQACLPANGMRAIPEQLASSLQRPVRLSTPVEAVKPNAVQVVAADWPRARELLRSLPAVCGTRSATWYFGLPKPAPVTAPLIVLQSYGAPSEPKDVQARVVNIGFSSIVQPSYAPAGHELAAVTVMGTSQEESWVRAEVERILGTNCSTWRHLRTYDIGFHQPAQVPLPPPECKGKEVDIEGVFCCGDHRSNPTLDGAMRNGREVAAAVIAKLPVH